MSKRKALSTVVPAAAAARATKGKATADENADENADEQIVPFEEKEATEQELVISRTKELKSLAVEDLKKLLLANGLETGKKGDMIASMLKHEAKLRKAAKEQKAQIRAVVVEKKQELERMPLPKLSNACEESGLKGLKNKEAKVQGLLVQWQRDGGVDKALAAIAHAARIQTLEAIDEAKLQRMCKTHGVDPYVKEIMVDRISKCECLKGCYARPVFVQESQAPKEEKGDMIEALLASEQRRKKESDLKRQEEEIALGKMKELKSLSLDDLKKRLAKKKIEANGKKDDMVQTLFLAVMDEEAASSRQACLKSKSAQELKELLQHNGLDASGGKDHMIKALLAHEAQRKEDLKAFEAKVREVIEEKKEALHGFANSALKEMCAEKGLPVGGNASDRIERLAEEMHKDPSVEESVSWSIRAKRRDALMAMEKPALAKLCEELEVSPLMKSVMIERILDAEAEANKCSDAQGSEPATKKPRKM